MPTRNHAEDSDADDHGDDDEDDFESAAAAPAGLERKMAPAGARWAAETATPHLLQNFVPAARVAPHELQNAITHLVRVKSRRREYIAELMGKQRR